MSDDRELLAAAIMANHAAWSSLVGTLTLQGGLNLQAMNHDLKGVQEAFRKNSNADIAEALDLHLGSIEEWLQESC